MKKQRKILSLDRKTVAPLTTLTATDLRAAHGGTELRTADRMNTMRTDCDQW